MSALARYFNSIGKKVGGYDKTPTELTKNLVKEGIIVNYIDEVGEILSDFQDREKTLVIYTPAIPKDHKQHQFFKDKDFEILKRAEI